MKVKKTGQFLKRSGTALLVCALTATTVMPAYVQAEEAADQVSGTWQSDYSSKEEVLDAGLALNQEVGREGMVLMRNENNTLPLLTSESDKTKVSVFGYAAIDTALGGDQNSDDQSAGYVTEETNIFITLDNAGYDVNSVIENAYTEWSEAVDEEGNAVYGSDRAVWDSGDGNGSALMTDELVESYEEYSDAAIVVLSETGYTVNQVVTHYKLDGEDFVDNDEYDPDRELDDIQTILTYDTQQKEMVEYVASQFDKVIVLLNTDTPHEVEWLDNMVDEGKVDSILQISEAGNGGLTAVGEILNGTVNPSGHTSDLWAADLTATPSFTNSRQSDYVDENGDTLSFYIAYEEGIYVGYRYYETLAYEMNQTDGSGEDWYESHVTYPFGYGLSYTSFDWEIVDSDVPESIDDADAAMTITVKVTNTGDYAGKDVVQLYYSAPYTEGSSVEKSSVALGDYIKTDMLEPGESQEVEVSITPSDISSYDYMDARTYVLEAGTYTLTLQSDSHTVKDGTEALSFSVDSDILCDTSASGATVTNQFDDLNDYMNSDGVETLSRTDMIGASASSWKLSDYITSGDDGKSNTYATADEFKEVYLYDDPVEGDPNYVAEEDMPVYADEETKGDKAAIQLSEMTGLDFEDEKWDEFLDQLSLYDLYDLVTYGGFYMADSEYLGLPMTLNSDGPKGWTGVGVNGTAYAKWASEPLIGSTWNKELLYEMGQMLGEEGLWGNSDLEDSLYSFTGNYGPGVNIHRTPFDSRYNEYYSEDAYLMGTLAANYCLGAASKGCYTYLKHMCLYEEYYSTSVYGLTSFSEYSVLDDAECGGLSVWCDEQTLREIYLRPFQIAIEDGDSQAVMASFSRIGSEWVGASYNLLTGVLRNEWGFDGIINTDIWIFDQLDSEALIYAGGSCMLQLGIVVDGHTVDIFELDEDGDPVTDEETGLAVIDYSKVTATKVSAMRESAKTILYVVCNSHSMQVPYGAAVIYAEDCAAASLEDGNVGETYEGAVAEARVNTYYAYSDVTYSVTEGEMPSGLELDAATGAVTGTPDAAGTYTFTVTASADGYESAAEECSITIAE